MNKNRTESILIVLTVVTMLIIGINLGSEKHCQLYETRIAELETEIAAMNDRIDTVAKPPRVIADVSVDPNFWREIESAVNELDQRVTYLERPVYKKTGKTFGAIKGKNYLENKGQ